VKNGRAILFLGAGASKECKNSRGETAPNADQLRDILSQKYMGKLMPKRTLMSVAEMAIDNGGVIGPRSRTPTRKPLSPIAAKVLLKATGSAALAPPYIPASTGLRASATPSCMMPIRSDRKIRSSRSF
jgi:hypothetical protein